MKKDAEKRVESDEPEGAEPARRAVRVVAAPTPHVEGLPHPGAVPEPPADGHGTTPPPEYVPPPQNGGKAGRVPDGKRVEALCKGLNEAAPMSAAEMVLKVLKDEDPSGTLSRALAGRLHGGLARSDLAGVIGGFCVQLDTVASEGSVLNRKAEDRVALATAAADSIAAQLTALGAGLQAYAQLVAAEVERQAEVQVPQRPADEALSALAVERRRGRNALEEFARGVGRVAATDSTVTPSSITGMRPPPRTPQRGESRHATGEPVQRDAKAHAQELSALSHEQLVELAIKECKLDARTAKDLRRQDLVSMLAARRARPAPVAGGVQRLGEGQAPGVVHADMDPGAARGAEDGGSDGLPGSAPGTGPVTMRAGTVVTTPTGGTPATGAP